MKGYYGGSFNPIHNGHLEVAEYLLACPEITEILFTPVYKHPFGKKLAPFEDRVEMIKLAVKGYEKLGVCLAEKEKGGVSYTVDLLEFLAKKGEKFFFIAGLDSLYDLKRWRDWESMVKKFNMVFTTRENMEIPKEILTEIEKTAGKWIKIIDNPEHLEPEGLNLVKVPSVPVSSSLVREKIAKGKNLGGLLPASVISYIYTKKLYRE